MKQIGIVLWHFPFFGFISASIAYILGLILVALVITAPIGLGLMVIAKMLFAPYTRELVDEKFLKSYHEREHNSAWEKYKTIIKIVWFIPGFFLFLGTFFKVFFYALPSSVYQWGLLLLKQVSLILIQLERNVLIKSLKMSLIDAKQKLKFSRLSKPFTRALPL